jgi:hypothetical protein
MSQLLTPANLDDVIKPIPIKKSSEFSKTQKNTSKLSNILRTLQEMDDDDNTTMGDFTPPPKPISTGTQRTTDNMNPYLRDANNSVRNPQVKAVPAGSPGLELNNLKYTYPTKEITEDYYKKYIPSYGQPPPTPPSSSTEAFSNSTERSSYNSANIGPSQSPIPGSNSMIHGGYIDKTLSDKLNYMIHLLEDKQDVKSNSKWEEIGLYCLLGVFTIFLVDSFSKVGKYVR